jgi:hypothetical protein
MYTTPISVHKKNKTKRAFKLLCATLNHYFARKTLQNSAVSLLVAFGAGSMLVSSVCFA